MMILVTAVGSLSLLARLVGFAGAAFSVGYAAWWMFSFFDALFSSSPNRHEGIATLGLMVLQALVAAWVVWSVLKCGPRSLLLVLAVAFVGSFFIFSGWYFLLFDLPERLFGIGNLLYLLAALLMVAARLVSVADERAREQT